MIGGLMKKIEDIKFNLNKEMLRSLLEFDREKRELNELYNLDKNDDVLVRIIEKEQKINTYRQKFIEDFRKANKSEITEYMNLKDN